VEPTVSVSHICIWPTSFPPRPSLILSRTSQPSNMDFKRHISHLFASFLSLLKMSQPQQPSGIEFVPNSHPDSLTTYLNLLERYETQAEMRSARIISIHLLKKKSLTEHESVAVMACDNQGISKVLVFERQGGVKVATQPQPPIQPHRSRFLTLSRKLFRPPTTTVPSSPSLEESSSITPTSSSSDRYAIDTVRTQNTIPDEDSIGTLVFPSHTPYIHQVTILANIVHENNTIYRLCSTNCYWFAGYLIALLEKEFDARLSPNSPSKQGYWKSIVSTLDTETLEELVASGHQQYQSRLKIFETKVCILSNFFTPISAYD
jgi:hypothetical protein